MDLIAAECLDPDPRSGCPEVLSEGEKDRLVATVKRNFTSWRMRIVDIKREAGLGHVSDSTILKVLNEWGIKPCREEFNYILKPENKVQRLVSEARIHIMGQLHL
jgi:transposase